MVLLCLLIALVLSRSFSIASSLQKDQWFYDWLDWLDIRINGEDNPLLFLLLALALPLLILSIGLALLAKISIFLVFLAAIALLIYSFGRGDWAHRIGELTAAYRSENTDIIYEQLADWLPKSPTDDGDWRQQAVAGVIYHAFERTFAVLFWFLLLGPIGAVLYRLTALLQNYKNIDGLGRDTLERWQWLLEWPAVRLLGLSFAVVGNFAGCYHQWKICALCARRKTQIVLSHYIQGALMSYQESSECSSIDDSVSFDDAVDIDVVVDLYKRALLLWICVLAVFWIL